MKKHTTAHVIFAATAMASQPAWALGFGHVVTNSILGQALQFTAPVHLGEGEHFGPECVAAEVYFGDARVPPNEVRTSVQRGASDNDWVVRISTVSAIQEPIVEIDLTAGCDRPFVRRFTAFADPPAQSWAGAAVAAASAPPVAATSPVFLAPVQQAARAAAGNAAPPATHPEARPASHKGPTLALAKELNARGHSVHRGPAAPIHGAAQHGTAAAQEAQEAPLRLVLDSGFAHLKMDTEDPVVSDNPAAAASAVAALADLDDPAARQLRELENSIQAMKRDTQANRDRAALLQAQLNEAQSRSDWLPYVLGLLAVAVAIAVALALKLRQQVRLAHSAWFNAPGTTNLPAPPLAAEPEPAPLPLTAGPAQAQAEPVPYTPAAEAEPPEEPSGAVVADMSTTQPLDHGAIAALMNQREAAAPRELSVEELLDLEQQADFFIALGQEDAAIDLLMSHLRSAGGQSPLPYTKLLEIYRRQGDRSAYERTRARFNRRFNAYAPDWETGPGAGRLLEDYPEAIAQVQAAWHAPLDAMAIVEALLFKRDDNSELFDLPAYRDVLLLYSIARDLWQQGGGAAGTQVDVLLPLDENGEPGLPPVGGLDLPMEGVGPSQFEMTGYEAPGEIDLAVPLADDGVHATLDTYSLAPVEPTTSTEEPPAPKKD